MTRPDEKVAELARPCRCCVLEPASLVPLAAGVHTFRVGLLIRRRNSQVVPPASRQELERQFYRRATKWAGTSVITWSIWALTGAPTWLPHVTESPHHTVVSAGIWPAYIMIGGLADLGRRARQIYVEPVQALLTAAEGADFE